MEPKFIIHNRNIQKMLTDAYGYYTWRMRYGVCGIFALIILGLGVAGRLPRVLESLLLYGALSVSVAWCIPRLVVGLTMRRVRKENGGIVPESLVTVEEEGIRVREGTAELLVPYSQITQAKRLRHGYLLAAAPASVMLDVTGFETGTPEEFAGFLREKRPDLKVR